MVKWSGLRPVMEAMVLAPFFGFAIGFSLMVLISWVCFHVTRSVATRLFKRLQLVSACFMAFSHGANDAQKAGGIATYVWGRANTVRIRHPLSVAVPMLGPFLDMPTEELPGDSNMPRVQGPTFGASERFAVSPGRVAEVIADVRFGGRRNQAEAVGRRCGDTVAAATGPALAGSIDCCITRTSCRSAARATASRRSAKPARRWRVRGPERRAHDRPSLTLPPAPRGVNLNGRWGVNLSWPLTIWRTRAPLLAS